MQTSDNSRGNWTSASNAQADALCPARHLMQRDLPEEPRGADADFGDRIHKALGAGTAEEILARAGALTLEEHEVYDACRRIELKVVSQHFATVDQFFALSIQREQRFWLEFAGVKHSGMPDVVYRCGKQALIFDYKTLPSDVPDSPRNYQLRDQCVLVAHNHDDLEQIACAIIQPLVTHTPELCVYDDGDLVRAEADLMERVIKSNDPKSIPIPGAVQCHFCRAKPKCVAYQQWAGSALPVAPSILSVPIADWDGSQCATFLDRRAIAQAWLDSATEMIKDRLKAGQSVPGYCLKDGQVRETVTDPQAVFDRFTKLGGDLAQYMGCLSVGKTKLKEAVHLVTGARGHLLDKAVEALIDGLVTRKQCEPSIVKGRRGHE